MQFNLQEEAMTDLTVSRHILTQTQCSEVTRRCLFLLDEQGALPTALYNPLGSSTQNGHAETQISQKEGILYIPSMYRVK